MANPTEDQKSEPNPSAKPEEAIGMTQYKKRFKEAVVDAQYMMMYASSNLQNDIEQGTIERLIKARQRVEKGEELSVEEEAGFWLDYQDLWKLVQPATAESIRADKPLETTLIGKLLGYIPFLSHWAEEWSISKARKSVNRYITFTALVLILLLVFQIYWVIGNQLTTQLNALLEKGAKLTLDFNTNQKEYRALELRYMQAELDSGSFNGQYIFKSSPAWENDILENQFTSTSLKADLEALSSQIDRNLKVLTAWSSPWYSLIDPEKTVEKTVEKHSPKYQSLFEDIDKQIEEKEKQLNSNQKVEEAVSSQNSPITKQLESIDNQLIELQNQMEDLGLQQTPEAQTQRKLRIDEISKFQAKREELLDLWSVWNATPSGSDEEIAAYDNIDKFEDVQILLGTLTISLKDSYNDDQVFLDLDSEKSNLENKLTTIDTQLADIQEQIKDLNSQRETLKTQLITDADIRTQWKEELAGLIADREKLVSREETYLNEESSRAAQLAGQFVLNILQSYILPILYGLLGAGTSVLRSLSKKIKDVTYSEATGVQHILSIALGALAGIMVGWFSFLIDTGTTSFLGSVSPLAIAFLVGYNIEPFFSRMDNAIKTNERTQQTVPATIDKTTVSKMDDAIKKFEAISQQIASGTEKEDQPDGSPQVLKPSSTHETAPGEKPAAES